MRRDPTWKTAQRRKRGFATLLTCSRALSPSMRFYAISPKEHRLRRRQSRPMSSWWTRVRVKSRVLAATAREFPLPERKATFTDRWQKKCWREGNLELFAMWQRKESGDRSLANLL